MNRLLAGGASTAFSTGNQLALTPALRWHDRMKDTGILEVEEGKNVIFRQKSRKSIVKQNPALLMDSWWDINRQPDALHAILDINPNLVSVKDGQGRYCYANQSFMQFYGFTGQQILGKTDEELSNREIAASNHLEDCQVLESDTGHLSAEQILTDHQGISSWHSTIRKRMWLGDEKAIHIVSVSTDISGLKNLEDRVINERLHDPLSGLPNLVSLKIVLSELAVHQPHGEACDALVIFDVSQVKRINETLGFGIGDQLITSVVRRLRRCVPPLNMIAHLKSDTFAVVIKNLSSRADVCPQVEKIFASLRDPFSINDHEINLTVNMGIAFGEQETLQGDNLLRDAQIAHSLAKTSKKSQYVVFEEYMRLLHNNHVELENDLRKASGQGQLLLHYQPIVSAVTGQVASIEALLRWQHPKRGLIYPDEFIGMAEESELIVGMGEWVLREACSQTRRWQNSFPNHPFLQVSVNVSSKQLIAEGFIDKVISILDETGLDPHHLKMEITESVYLGKSGQVLTVLNQLTQLGVKLYIDDFGTGYSSLSYLSQIPFDAIKIDRSFIDGVVIRHDDTMIVEAIVRLASDLGKELVAEGVETLEQREWLRHMGCQYEQGFLFSHPLDAQQVEQFFQVNI